MHAPRARGLVAGVVLLVLLAGIGVVGGASPAGASGSVTIAGPEEFLLLSQTNQARSQSGLGPLSDDMAARNVARAWAVHMAATRGLAHNPYLASQVSQQVTPAWTALAENVGVGSSGANLQASFMASAPHRANILGDYNRVGVGAAWDTSGSLWVSVVFIKGPSIPYVAPGTWAPFWSPYDLAQDQYVDFLGHMGASDGVDYWATYLRSGQLSAPAVLNGFLRCTESQAEVAPVVRLYYAYFLRMPDYSGLSFWLAQVRGGVSAASVSDAFARSREFINRYGSLSNGAFVDLVYDNVLHRDPDPEGRDFWVGQLAAGRVTRGDVMLGFSESSEYKAAQAAEVDVVMTYVAMLRRAPDSEGYSYWRSQLESGTSVEALMNVILDSAEYRNRVT